MKMSRNCDRLLKDSCKSAVRRWKSVSGLSRLFSQEWAVAIGPTVQLWGLSPVWMRVCMRSLYRALNGCQRRGQSDQPQWNAPAGERPRPSCHPRRCGRLRRLIEPTKTPLPPSSGRHDRPSSTCSASTCVTSSARLTNGLLLQPVHRQKCVATDAKLASSCGDLQPSPFIPNLAN